jgi:hypothetical protein
MVKGWHRDKDENTTCHEGYLKKQKTHQENQDDSEAQEDSTRANPCSKWHQ